MGRQHVGRQQCGFFEADRIFRCCERCEKNPTQCRRLISKPLGPCTRCKKDKKGCYFFNLNRQKPAPGTEVTTRNPASGSRVTTRNPASGSRVTTQNPASGSRVTARNPGSSNEASKSLAEHNKRLEAAGELLHNIAESQRRMHPLLLAGKERDRWVTEKLECTSTQVDDVDTAVKGLIAQMDSMEALMKGMNQE